MADKRQQVIDQCKVVAHLATALAKVHHDYITIMAQPASESILDQVGERTAGFMEDLGNMLNGMDATDEADDWTAPIFAEAQKLWPAAARQGA